MRPLLSALCVVPGNKRRAVLAFHSEAFDRYYPVRALGPPNAPGRDPFPRLGGAPLAYLPASDR